MKTNRHYSVNSKRRIVSTELVLSARTAARVLLRFLGRFNLISKHPVSPSPVKTQHRRLRPPIPTREIHLKYDSARRIIYPGRDSNVETGGQPPTHPPIPSPTTSPQNASLPTIPPAPPSAPLLTPVHTQAPTQLYRTSIDHTKLTTRDMGARQARLKSKRHLKRRAPHPVIPNTDFPPLRFAPRRFASLRPPNDCS